MPSESPNELTFADVVEGVRAAIAAYTQALDDWPHRRRGGHVLR